MRKAQGLPISTMILILLGLIVLVIVIAMVVQKVKSAGKGIREIEETECKPPLGNARPIGYPGCDIIYGSFKGLDTNMVCCRIKDDKT